MKPLTADERTALIGLDVEYFRSQWIDGDTIPSDHVVLTALHKMRYEIQEVPKDCRHASGQWLRERGYGRVGGFDLLPEGELPTGEVGA